MTLPSLPKIYKRKEAKITPKVFAWLEKNYPHSCAVEVKIKGSELKPHQKIALSQVDKGNFSYKIPDMGRSNPFDGFVLKNADALVVVCEGRKCQVEDVGGNYLFAFKV